MEALDSHASSIESSADRSAFVAQTALLRAAILPYTTSRAAGVPGAERVLNSYLDILRKWISVERRFCDAPSYADAVDSVRKSNKDNFGVVLETCRAHEQLHSTSYIISRIISAIGDGSRFDVESNATPIGKRVSVVAGASGLASARPAIAEIGSMGNSASHAKVALQARKILMQESMPSLEQRKARVLDAAKKLSMSDSKEADQILADQLPLLDVFFPLLKKTLKSKDEIGLLELYARRLYRTYTLKNVDRMYDDRVLKFLFLNKPSEKVLNKMHSVSSITELSQMLSNASLSKLGEAAEGGADSKLLASDSNNEKIPSQVERTGVVTVVESLKEISDSKVFTGLLQNFPQFTSGAPSANNGPVNVLYLVVSDVSVAADDASNDALAQQCQAALAPHQELLGQAQVRRVTFSFNRTSDDDFEDHNSPATFTYSFPEFAEESLIRSIDPSHAMHLDLNRVASNFKVRSLGSRHTSGCHVHLYEGVPRESALAKDKKANPAARIFARALSFSFEFSSATFERILVDALNALDLNTSHGNSDNHLFVNLVSDFEKAVLDPVVVEQVVVDILKRHGDRVNALGIVEVETRIVCSLSVDSPPIALRLVASNPTGYVHVMNTYVEAAAESGGDRVFKLIGGTKASLASAGDSSWEGLNVNTPYPLTRPFDAQRKAALRSSDTLYCYDLPALFEAAVEDQWQKTSEGAPARPLMVMYTTELVVKRKDGSDAPWTIQDYADGKLELAHVSRGAGANDVGMVAWLMNLKTVEYPNGRQVVLIANDITHKAGSFGTREDVVFKLASEFARSRRIPRLYIAANSGARIGLADSVKKAFKVAFKDPQKPENGFDYLYLDKSDYESLTTDKQRILAEPAQLNGKEIYRITDIIGSEPDLGVENLKGSGLIAGETSLAYEDIFTMTIVLGRTVGIGAYLVRLGQRTIQKTSASPIILTGYQALNKLMGVDVYSTNDQLGGPGIMYSNGISHLAEPDHLQAVKAAIDWLSFVPSTRGGLLPITDVRGVDEIERPITFMPKAGVPYDPRMLLAGGEDDNGSWQSGFFDKDSFTETLAGWAKTVVVGRARLGGIPMGVVITENRTAENIKPADPADVKASEAVIQEAGCVWFPNSAYKTAQAINDFRTEDLPLIVFANWRGFSGGQRDMFDEVLKYGSLIVDAFVSYEQPVFVYIPPYGEIRGGAWVVLDASINANVMEMYATSGTARGGVLEANGAASVKYRTKDLITTMHRLDDQLISLDAKLKDPALGDAERSQVQESIKSRERALLPVYEQISVQFCELHDTPGRMKAVGVIERQVEWREARSFFYWRLRRKLAEYDLRKKIIEAAQVGRSVKAPTPLEASAMVKAWFLESTKLSEDKWIDDKQVLQWMGEKHQLLETKVVEFTKHCVAQEVVQVMTAGGQTAKIGTMGIIEGLSMAYEKMSDEDKAAFKSMLGSTFSL